jgi:hypothetical protein
MNWTEQNIKLNINLNNLFAAMLYKYNSPILISIKLSNYINCTV